MIVIVEAVECRMVAPRTGAQFGGLADVPTGHRAGAAATVGAQMARRQVLARRRRRRVARLVTGRRGRRWRRAVGAAAGRRSGGQQTEDLVVRGSGCGRRRRRRRRIRPERRQVVGVRHPRRLTEDRRTGKVVEIRGSVPRTSLGRTCASWSISFLHFH